MRTVQVVSLNAADATQTSQTSSPVFTDQWFSASCEGIASGTLTGTLKLQACNDNGYSSFNPPPSTANWVDIPNETVSITAAGNFLIPQFFPNYPWMRVVYTKSTSSTGATITAELRGQAV